MSQDFANYIARVSLDDIRRSPADAWNSRGHDQWLKGRISACESLFSSIETVSAENESKFLVSYHQRHKVYKS